MPTLESPPPRGPSRKVSPSCLSNLALDALLSGDLSGPGAARSQAHLAACVACAAAFEALRLDRDEFLREQAIPRFAAEVRARAAELAVAPRAAQRRRWQLWVPLAMAGGLGAASLLLWSVSSRPASPWTELRPAESRTKGAGGDLFSIAAEVQPAEGGPLGRHVPGAPVRPGDRLQLRLSMARAGHVAVVAVDAARKVSVYFPPGAHSERLSEGDDLPLRTAVELDQTLGPETVIALRCDSPLAVAAIVDAAARAADSRHLGALGLPCQEARYHLEKVARAR